MELIAYAAISLDGYIAKINGDSDWVNDDISFKEAVNNAGCIIVGQKIFFQFLNEIYPVENVYNYVLTNNPSQFKNNWDNVEFTNATPTKILESAKIKGFNKIVIVGGAQTITHFLNSGLVTQIVVNVHPIILGAGMKLFAGEKDLGSFELITAKNIENGLIQLQYRINF